VLKLQGANGILESQRLCVDSSAALILDSREIDIASHVHELIEGVGTDVICGAADMEMVFLAVNPACRAQGTFQGCGWLGIETCFAG
jgi:hypothetical protein